MPIGADDLERMVEAELQTLRDTRVLQRIRLLLVDPVPVMRAWNYGAPGERYACWTVLEHPASDTGIAYCESGFGPRQPWGLVWLRAEEERHLSIGMDSGWFPRFLDAFFDSFAATELPIWRVFKQPPAASRGPLVSAAAWCGEPVGDEGSWEAAWRDVEERRRLDPASRYVCYHSISYGEAPSPPPM